MPRRIFTIHFVFIFIFFAFFVKAQGVITTIAGGGQFQFSGAGGPAVNVPLGLIQGVASDRQGNVYASDASNFLVVKIAPNGVLTIVAGNGTAGTGGDGCPATSASLQIPAALAVDAAGNVFFVDGNRVRKVTPQGVISTFAGSLLGGDSGDGGPATQALLASPQGLAVDGSGNLYVASGCRVRKVTPQGIISGVAGNSNLPCFAVVDGVSALNSPLNVPSGLAIDQNGVMYIAQSQDGRIRRVSIDGIITTIAGASGRGVSGDGGPAIAAMLNAPTGLALDSLGDLYISDNNRIREITTDGIIHTVTGTGTPNFTGDQGPASLASISPPTGVATDASGNVYIADSANSRVRRIDSSGTITTYAGSGNLGFAGDGGQARDAVLHTPWGIVADPAGNVLFSDAGNHRVRKIAPNGVITTIAGGSAPGFAGDGGPATQSLLNGPLGLVLDPAGNLYIADSQNLRVRKIDANGMITTVAGSGSIHSGSDFDTGDGGRAIDAPLLSVTDIAVDTQGNLYILENALLVQWAIRRVSPEGTITTFASGSGNLVSITVDTADNVYASTAPAQTFHGTFAVGGLFRLAPDGTNSPGGPAQCGSGVKGAVDAQGNFYLPEAGPPGPSGDNLFPGCTFNAVLRISPAGVVTTVAGVSPQAGFAGDDGPATSLQIRFVIVELCAESFDWAQYKRTKGALKLHLILDHDGYLPCYAVMTEGKAADITEARKMQFESGTLLVFDRGYSDYDWWLKLTRAGVNFVTRLKDSALYGVVESRPVPENSNVMRDEVIVLVSQQEVGPEARLRRIEVWVEEKNETMVFVTNNLKLAARTIARIYQERWHIELF